MGSNHVRLPETNNETLLVDQTQRAFARQVTLPQCSQACGEEEEGLPGRKSGLTALLLWRGVDCVREKLFGVGSSRSPCKLLSKSGLCPPKFHRCFCKFAIMAHAHRSRRWQVDGGQIAGKWRADAGKWQASGRQVAGKCARVAGKQIMQSIGRWRLGWRACLPCPLAFGVAFGLAVFKV